MSAGYRKLHQRTVDSHEGLTKRQVFKCATNQELRKFNIKSNKTNNKLKFKKT